MSKLMMKLKILIILQLNLMKLNLTKMLNLVLFANLDSSPYVTHKKRLLSWF